MPLGVTLKEESGMRPNSAGKQLKEGARTEAGDGHAPKPLLPASCLERSRGSKEV